MGAMSARWREWRRLGAPRLLVQWLRNGVPLKWRGRAPQPSEGERGAGEESETTRELRALVRGGAFEEGEATVVSPTFLIPKRDGSSRLIHDLRGVNEHLAPPRFTLHGAREAGEVVRHSEWLAVLDLKHGYQQVAMAPEARRYLGARMGDRTVVATVLPFGLSLSPYIFTRLTGWLAREVRRRFGLQVAVYIDDFLIGAASREELERGLQQVKDLFSRLGVVVATEKEVQPSKSVEFIGYLWDAERKVVAVPRERRAEYRRAVKNLLRHPQSRDTWRRVVGKLGFLREAVGPTMRHIRSLLHTIAARRHRGLIAAEGEARTDLEWWAERLASHTELSLRAAPVSGSITTDASDNGLGFLVSLGQSGHPERQVRFERAMQAAEPEAHINRKELEAVLRALEEHRQDLQGRRVVWYSDSTTALAAVRRQGTQRLSPAAWTVTKKVLDLAEEARISLLPRHVPGRLNGAADALSRLGEARSAWERALETITRRWGPLEEDPCGAVGDATSLLEGLSWATRRTLLWPRIDQLGEVVRHLGLCVAEHPPAEDPTLWTSMAVLVTPLWRGASWWPAVERWRADFVPLGRLGTGETEGWRRRNGHEPEWTASLLPLETRSGRPARPRSTEEPCSASSSGRRHGDWRLAGEAQERQEA